MRKNIPFIAGVIVFGLLTPSVYGNPIVMYSPNRALINIGFF